ncbi:outer membrane channel protein TolC [Frischella perrara]|jgi:type I secretion outer membrane protein, TolC family|uniref:Outer membrane channel protein TolC n=1 Tax=Frischella perrara TaxID=1267021 RepID=A0A0A7S3B9_FRIPE|nr:outer membrane channel protein TolC [Frischella perrara]AJA45332.1 type I secretion outer membrane protein, TolC family [Frischella perrara]MCT6875227.1 outer membrane channel protein TolC [Frischella perrara]PWV62982.1 outer membrane protein [Frischella perrara]PXY94815.1 outer membrane channel protein TolC [Frischella perrara]
MKKVLPLLISIVLAPSAFAENLIQVYEQARLTNPDLKSSIADKEKAYSAISEQRASLLPQLGLNASYGLTHGYRENKDINNKSGKLGLSLNQSIFNYANWKKLDITKQQASVADIAYQSKEQALILNTATNYFKVLRAIDTLSYVESQKKAIYRQLEQTRQKHKVGLVAITDVQNAQANYDLTIAEQVSSLNDLNNALEDLRQVSGRFYANLATIDIKAFKTENPSHISKLLQLSENANLDLLTARLSRDIAKEQIRLAQSGHLPTISLNASTGLNKNENYGDKVGVNRNGSHSYADNSKITGANTIGISFDMPIFTGGATMSQVSQAQYNYVSFSEKLESTNRAVINKVRSSYNNISAAISSIKAYEQSVVSAQSSLDATQSGYEVGTRTIVDVLTATTQLYDSKKKLANSKYDYLISLLQMKSAIGTLTANDLLQLNSMLGKETTTLITIK